MGEDAKSSEFRPLRTLLIGFGCYLLVFNYPEILLHLTCLGVGGHENAVFDTLAHHLTVRCLVDAPISFLANFGAGMAIAAAIVIFIVEPIRFFLRRGKPKAASNPCRFEKTVLIGGLVIACLLKLQVEVIHPQTSKKQFQKESGAKLPNGVTNYRAWHSTGGYASTIFAGTRAYYSFTTNDQDFQLLSKNLQLRPASIDYETRAAQLLIPRLPKAMLGDHALGDFQKYEASSKLRPDSCPFRFVLRHPSGQTICLFLNYPK